MFIVSIKDKDGILLGVFEDEPKMNAEVFKHFNGGEYRATEVKEVNKLFLLRKEKNETVCNVS